MIDIDFFNQLKNEKKLNLIIIDENTIFENELEERKQDEVNGDNDD